ncbi:MAG: crossover junction endodeoxyribonuclease RuvC [Chitinophagaceae bacterium]|nr:MAG: crossover junction endodeoxyribonuclease RuvC [Chitinophagaceae bacterium]
MGYGLVAVTKRSITLVEMDVFKLPATMDGYEKLERIFNKVAELISTHRPHSFAIEAPFFGKNVQSMLKLGRAQGVAIAAAIQAGLPVTEYSPKKVKQSITGNGNACKEQVMKMMQRLLQFDEDPKFLDATDALAVAVCHHFQQSSPVAASAKMGGWKSFIADNPDRVLKRKAG